MGECICENCPSFVKKEQIRYCFTGKSKSIKKEKGCICPGCPVYKKNNFKGVYFCTKGKA